MSLPSPRRSVLAGRVRARAVPASSRLPGVFLLCGVAACCAPPAAAQTAATSLPAVAVTATRQPLRVDETVADVSVIERAAIERATGRTLSELLAQQPGLQSSSNGGLGKPSSVFVRGLEARHVLLLVDGVRLGSATVGTATFDNLPLDAIERIEIVRGPLSGLYGSDAVGGVVQIFTRRGRPGTAPNAKATVGANRYGQLAGGVTFGEGGFDAALQVQHTETRGFSATNPNVPFGSFNEDRDGFDQNAGTLRLGWRVNPDWRLDALALQSEGVTRLDDGAGGADARARLRNTVQSLQAAGRVAGDWRSRLAFGRSTDVYDTLASDSAFPALGAIGTVQKQLTWENTLPTRAGTVLALVERIDQDVSKPGTPFDVGHRRTNALALGLDGAAAGHVWQLSLRHDRNSQFGHHNTGSLGWGYAIAPSWRVNASYGTSFVAPSFNQLYYPSFGNPNLEPETGRSAEVSLRWTSGVHSVRAAYFDNRIRGYISSGPAPVNIPRTRIDGVSLAYEGRWRDWVLGASYDHVDPRNATEGSANFDKQLPRRAKDAVKAHADWSAGAFGLGATLAAFSERYDDAANTRRLGGYGTLDLRAEWRFAPAWTLAARVNNVGGKVYETAYGYNQPGREGYLTVRYSPR